MFTSQMTWKPDELREPPPTEMRKIQMLAPGSLSSFWCDKEGSRDLEGVETCEIPLSCDDCEVNPVLNLYNSVFCPNVSLPPLKAFLSLKLF